MYILANMWFTKLIKQFFFWIDKIVFNFISIIYDLMISIARTSVLSQADIVDMADRIYTLLLIFMVFKVTLSLITYTVNPDDFTDKSKGVAKLGQKIIISLALLILTPYIFNYAYQFQTIILEDNSLATLIFGENTDDRAFLNSAGDEMAFLTFSAFLSPNLALDDMHVCSKLVEGDKFNPECESQLADRLDSTTFVNYKAAIENDNLGLLLRQDLVLATTDDNTEFVMDYKFIFSTVVGFIIILLLLTFCMDVAVRSIKLAFLQLVAPIPILSYVDPKGGKDGMFKKWYEMCFKTFLSLFIRLLALYFAVYIISKVADLKLVDIVDGSYQTNLFIRIFIIIGALMFAKQLPKILEGLGIKLDGDGKFTLNPLKKFEEGALGGKRITGMARGAAVGMMGAASGAGIGRAFSGAYRGFKDGKGWKETGKSEKEMNRKMRQAKLDGSNFGGRMSARFSNALGIPSQSENIEGRIHKIDERVKDLDNSMDPSKKRKEEKKLYTDAISAMQTRAVEKIKEGKAGELSDRYNAAQARVKTIEAQLENAVKSGANPAAISALEGQLASAQTNAAKIIDDLKFEYIDANMSGDAATRTAVFGSATGGDKTLTSLTETMEKYYTTYSGSHTSMELGDARTLDKALGTVKGEMAAIDRDNAKIEKQKRDLEASKKELYEKQRKAKANETAIK